MVGSLLPQARVTPSVCLVPLRAGDGNISDGRGYWSCKCWAWGSRRGTLEPVSGSRGDSVASLLGPQASSSLHT